MDFIDCCRCRIKVRNLYEKETGLRLCKKCNEYKPIEQYDILNFVRQIRRRMCKGCRKEYNSAYYKKRKEARDKFKYSITPDSYLKETEEQETN